MDPHSKLLLRAENLRAATSSDPALNLNISTGTRLGIWTHESHLVTRFLRALARVRHPFSGRLYWNETEVTRKPRWLIRNRRHTALVWHNPYAMLDPNARVERILSRATTDDRAIDAGLQSAGLSPAVRTYPVRDLSGLNRVRLVLGYVQLQEPRVLLVDDVFRHLPVECWPALRCEIHRSASPEAGLVIASHAKAALTEIDTLYVLAPTGWVEWGRAASILSAPQHPYTRRLVGQREGNRPEQSRADPEKPVEIEPGHWVRGITT